MWGFLGAQFQNKGRWRARESLKNVGEGLRLVPIKGQGPGKPVPEWGRGGGFQKGVMGPDWLGNLAGETLVSNKRELPLFWSSNGDCGGWRTGRPK